MGVSIAIPTAGFLFLQRGLWLSVVPPVFGTLASTAFVITILSQRERVERRELMRFFRRFASSKVADELWRRREEFMDGRRPSPQQLNITALLSDLKGFTEASEKMQPHVLMEWVNSYMDAMTRVIEAHSGHVDDYVGDGIKANFGVPLASRSETAIAADAVRAVECALDMGSELERLNAEWESQGLPTARQRIGLCTGPVVVGSLGSADAIR